MNRFLRRVSAVSVIASTVLLGACATTGVEEDPYVLFREHMPRSILVLPPVNESLDVNASYSWLTTASKPIAEKGFYVFPVAIVDEFMKENGLPNPAEMHGAPLDKLGEVFGADAVMYVTLEDFGQKFELLSSVTTVIARAEILDVGTGQVIWNDRVVYRQSNSNSSGGGLLGALVSAAAAQITENLSDATHDAARLANDQLFDSPGERRGLLWGPAHPLFEAQMERAAARAAEAQALSAGAEAPAE